MSVKNLVVLTTLATENEQTGVTPKVSVGPATFNSREYGEFSRLQRATFLLDVSAVSGTTPTLDVTIEAWNPVAAKWYTVVTFPQQIAASPAGGLAPINADLWGTIYRAKWVIGGSATPTFTFSLCAFANTEEPVS